MSERSGYPGLGVPRLMAPHVSLSAPTYWVSPCNYAMLQTISVYWLPRFRAGISPCGLWLTPLHRSVFILLSFCSIWPLCRAVHRNQLPRAPGLPGTHLLTTFFSGSKAFCLHPKLPCSWLALGSLRNPSTYLHIEYLLQVSKELFPSVATL